MAGSGAGRPRPGLAHGWTQGPAAEDASVLARTDVRAGGHRVGHPIHLLVCGDDSRAIAAPVTRDLAHAFPGLCLDRVDGIEDLAAYDASLNPGDHVLMGLVTSEVADIDALIDRAGSFPSLRRMQWVVVTDRSEHRDLARCVQSDALASVLKSPWTVPLLAGQAYSTMVRYLRGCGYSERQIRSLTRRLMRAEDLEAQKEALAATLEDLRATRAELVERARFAMLGELSAGIAHELNNPVTALVRAAKHLHEDVDAALAAPATASSREAMARALTAPPRSTSVERALMKELLPVVGDRTLARRLVRAGIQGADGARALAQIPGGIDAYEAGARLGGSLRSVLAAGDRVIELTQSLKGYARPDAEDLKPVDVREGIDDVLRLTAHRVRGIRIDCDYEDVPPVCAHPAKLQQVWTNLIVNAAEAIEDENADLVAAAEASGGVPELPARGEAEALIRITVRPTPEGVSVTIHDNGPGIDPGIVDKMMEPHFTTKAGRVRFGLGMGMSIVRSIIADHGGALTIDSHPGSTIMRISLPAQLHEEES